MATERIKLNHIPRILSNKPLLEYFLSVLQDKTVELPCWPKEVPWDSCYPFPDLFVRFNGEMLVTLSANPFDPKHLVDELRMAVKSDGPACSVVISHADIAGLGQSHCRIVPMAVSGSEAKCMDSSWQIHVLTFSQRAATHNAPPEIQQLLDHLAGEKIEAAPGSLLDRMLHEDFVWCWLNDARHVLKDHYAAKYEKFAKEYPPNRAGMIIDGYSEEFIKGYTQMKTYTSVLQHALSIAPDREKLFTVCKLAGIPGPMVQDALDGKAWTWDDLLQWYETALAEEDERRRAAAEAQNDEP